MTDMQDVTRQYGELADRVQNLVRGNAALADLLNTKTRELSESFATRTRLTNQINELERKLDKQEPYLPSTHELAARNQRQALLIADLQEGIARRDSDIAEMQSAMVELKVSENEDRCEAYPPADNPYLRETALRLAIDQNKNIGLSHTDVIAAARSFELYLSTPTEKETR